MNYSSGTTGESTCESAFGVCNSIFSEIMDVVGDVNVWKHVYILQTNEKCF